jgi:3-oxoadipate enol-lactonase
MAVADLSAVRLHYTFEGAAGQPVLVFSNSLGADLTMWEGVAAAFSERFRILRYDTRGHGASEVPDPPYTLPALGNDLLVLLDKLDVLRFFFCGLSLGGMTGMWLGANAPDRVEGLVLANTAARIGTEESWNARIERAQTAGLEPMAGEILGRWFTSQTQKASIVNARRILTSTSVSGYAGCCAAIRDADLTSSLHRIQAPTLVITGTWDPATPPSQGKALTEQIRGAAYMELPAAHLSAIERPAEFSNAMQAFFDRLGR